MNISDYSYFIFQDKKIRLLLYNKGIKVLNIDIAVLTIIRKSFTYTLPSRFRKFLIICQLILPSWRIYSSLSGIWGGRGKLFITLLFFGSFSPSNTNSYFIIFVKKTLSDIIFLWSHSPIMTKNLVNNAFENFVNIQYFVFISESLNIFHEKINCLDYNMEKTKKTYLNILEVNYSSTLEDLKKAYKRLALKWHPDKHSNNKHFAQ